jgi:uncharacterized protein YbaP (TraB family)
MKKNLVISVGVTFLLMVGLASSANAKENKSIEANTKASIVTTNRPAIWQLSDEDTVIYLFGTVHVLSPKTQWQTERLDAVLLATDVTYLEADESSAEALADIQQAVGQYGLNPPGVTLSSLLGESLAARFSAVVREFGLSMEQLEPLRPWLASLSLAMVALQKLGLDESSGADKLIETIARTQNDNIRYLESGSSQILAMASLDDSKDYAMFEEGLDQLQNFEQEIHQMIDAWKVGDEKAMQALLVQELKNISQQGYDILFVNRNKNWVAQISHLMAGKGHYFIAVGAGHLVGNESVVAMLKDKGFEVSRVQ